MKKFLKYFNNEYAEQNLNFALANRDVEPPLYKFILDVFYSLETTGYVKLLDWEHITDESLIDPSKFIVTRKRRSKSKKNKQSFIDMEYDRCSLLRMYFRVEVKGEIEYRWVPLLLPKMDENNFMTLKSKRVYLLYQMVDNSTYTTKNSIVLKAMMPLCITRSSYEITDTNLGSYTLPTYKIAIFQHSFNPLLFLAVKRGLTKSLGIGLFNVGAVLRVEDIDTPEREGWTYFVVQNMTTTKKLRDTKVKVAVVTKFFETNKYLRAMVAMTHELLSASAKPDLDKIEDINFWLDELGYLYTKDRNSSRDMAISTLVFWDRVVDRTTKRILKMHKWNKMSVDHLVVNLIQNFDEYKQKDNNDINNKRLRLNECIGAITNQHIGRSINRILSKGDKVTLDEVVNTITVAPNLILSLLYKSPLITYNDIVNDMDFFCGYKFTIKGPNSIGKNSERKVVARDRGVQLSSIGKIDADVCSSSSPGLGGLVSPFVKTSGLHFSPDYEPEASQYEFFKETEKYLPAIHCKYPDTYDEYIQEQFEKNKELRECCKLDFHGDKLYVRLNDNITGRSYDDDDDYEY